MIFAEMSLVIGIAIFGLDLVRNGLNINFLKVNEEK